MKPEIKNRIEQIKNGEIPQGYKKTKVGIIPNDWEVTNLSKCITEYKKLSNDIENIPVYSSSRSGLIKQSDYYNGKEAIRTNIGYKIVPYKYVTYRHMSDDDIFHFNINLTGDSILVSSEYPVFNSSDIADLYFIVSILNTTKRFKYFCKMQKLGGTRTRLYFKNLSKFQLSMPNKKEQQKIAEILTVQDKVIELKEKLITEKERQRKYLMQQLLTGKKRLKGFSSEWKNIRVSDIFKLTRGLVLPTSLIKNEPDVIYKYPVYSSQTKNNGLLGYFNEYLYENAITWTTDGANAGFVCYRNGQFYCTNVCGVLINNDGYANKCIAEILNSITKKYVSYVGNPKLMNNTMGEINIKIPPLDEQNAIAEILSKADKEIELLKQDLEQEKLKKKALMQLLLTGIVRV